MNTKKIAKCVWVLSLTASGCFQDTHEYLSGQCAYVDEAYDARIILCPNDTFPSIISDYAYDEEYIVALQIPDSESYERKEYVDVSVARYWIRDNTNRRVYGPLTKEEYEKKRVLLRISKRLELDTNAIHEYR